MTSCPAPQPHGSPVSSSVMTRSTAVPVMLTPEGYALSRDYSHFLPGVSIDLSSKRQRCLGQGVTLGSRKSGIVCLVNDAIAMQCEVAFRAADFSPNTVL